MFKNPFTSIGRALKKIANATLNAARHVANAEAPIDGQVARAVPTRSLQSAQPRISGVQLAWLRTQKRSFPSGRMGRSKYMPNGIPCRDTKLARSLEGVLGVA